MLTCRRILMVPCCFLCGVLTLALTINGIVEGQEFVAGASVTPLPAGEAYISPNFPGTQWLFVSGRKDAAISETWKLGEDAETKAPILICKGEPHGYLKTRHEFANFDLQLDWRFPTDPNGNSGILLFTTGEDRIWPASLQVQLHQPELGSTFPIGGAKSTNELRPVNKVAKPVGQWNHCEIHCCDGVVSVTINGEAIGDVSGCVPTAGTIALQSEGSEIHFRAISIREIPVAQVNDISLETDAAKAKQQ